MNERKASGSLILLLVGLFLLATVGALVAFVPFYSCFKCEIEIGAAKGISALKAGPAAPVVHNCPHCNGYGRVTPLTHWLKCSKHFDYFQFK